MRKPWMVAVLWVACGNDGDGHGRSENSLGARFRDCALVSATGSLNIGEPESADERCAERCLLAAECSDLEGILCSSGEAQPDVSETVSTCLEACWGESFVCAGGGSIPGSWVCDGFEDCEDGSDEQGCATEEFACESGERIDATWTCDGETDCSDGSDEQDCGGMPFTCGSGESVPRSYVCDLQEDCTDGSDEDQGCATITCG